MNPHLNHPSYTSILRRSPNAWATLIGSPSHPTVTGQVRFYETPYGVLVAAEVTGLPVPSGRCEAPVFGFHLHDGTRCTGSPDDPFSDAGMHYNPGACPHPHHAGDFPPLLGVRGRAFSAFLTDRFAVDEIIGKAVIIHAMPDDFTTQPSGNSGARIACGVVRG